MKITFEATEPDRNYPQHSVEIELKGDDHAIDKVHELCLAAMMAWGFHWNSVKEYDPEYQDSLTDVKVTEDFP